MKRSSLVWSYGLALSLVACGPHPGGDTGTPDAGSSAPITVTGKVLTTEGHVADTTAMVFIPGNNRQAQAVDATGSFTISDVTPPYDLYVAHKELNTAVIYKGLTLTTPTVAGVVFQSPAHFNSFSISGTITGRQTTSDANNTKVAFRPNDVRRPSKLDEPNSSGSYSTPASWYGDTTTRTGSLFAFQSKASSDTSVPTSYLAYGRRDNVTLSTKGSGSQDIALSPVANSTLAGSTTLPSGYTLSAITLDLYPDASPSQDLELFKDTSPASSFSYAVPQIPGATLSVALTASSTANAYASTTLTKTGLTAGTNNLSVVFQAPPLQLQPAPGAKDVTLNTKLAWSPFAGGVYASTLTTSNLLSGKYYVYILQSGTETTLPDLSPVGIALPASTDMLWIIQGYAPVASVDAMSSTYLLGSLPGDSALGYSLGGFTTAAAP